MPSQAPTAHRQSASRYWEQQYNPRATIPDAGAHFERWKLRAAQAKRALPGWLDIRYGDHERERLDLFAASPSRGALIFLHGGYWRAFGKDDFSWIAPPLVGAGVTVAVVSYPLSPQARIAHISDSVTRALCCLLTRGCIGGERGPIVLAGHSAGAQLAARHLALARLSSSAHAPCVDAIVAISGIYDLLPLLHTEMLGGMGWNAEELHHASPLFAPAPASGTVILAVGDLESTELKTQSRRLADAWQPRRPTFLEVAGRHHFDVLDSLSEPGQPLFERLLALFKGAAVE